ncbi:MAG TPA: hypothetical protein VLV16_07400 [Gemmatimonadales bacterium]|nr:hypothetical protein [Gemmatimonadales bacterium]
MPLRPLYGHLALRERLGASILAGRLPQAILLDGPHAVGKQRLALWIAQALLCEGRADTGGQPCGSCQPCRLVLSLSHPDVHWFVPLEPPKKTGDADRQVEIVEEALGEEVAARREQPLYGPVPGQASHGIAAIRLLGRRLRLTPAMGRWKVFIIGGAERLAAQAANPEAANALLKALEEPPADAVVILAAAEPRTLPATILSRVVRVRVARVQDSVVTEFAQRELGLTSQSEVNQRVRLADGCIGRLLALGGQRADGTGKLAEAFLGAVRQGPAARFALALAQQPFQARGGFTALLDDLLEQLRHEARAGGDSGRVVAAMAQVLGAREQAQGNVNPQLLTAVMADDLGA